MGYGLFLSASVLSVVTTDTTDVLLFHYGAASVLSVVSTDTIGTVPFLSDITSDRTGRSLKKNNCTAKAFGVEKMLFFYIYYDLERNDDKFIAIYSLVG